MVSIPELRWFQMSAEERESMKLRLSHLLEPRNEIVFAYLLGSFQRGSPFRDIDIAVFLESSLLQQNEELFYRFRLMDELERAVGYPIDVQLLNNAPCGFRYNALQGALLLSRDESVRAEWGMQILQEYLDFEPSFNRIAQTLLNQLRAEVGVDTRVFIKRISSLRQNLQMVRQIVSSEEPQSLMSDVYKLAALKWYLLLAIEDTFALCTHAITQIGGEAPTSYAECFEILHRRGVVEASLLENLRAMARFRNLLVHRYWDVDDSRVLELCQNNLSDLETFATAVADYFGFGETHQEPVG